MEVYAKVLFFEISPLDPHPVFLFFYAFLVHQSPHTVFTEVSLDENRSLLHPCKKKKALFDFRCEIRDSMLKLSSVCGSISELGELLRTQI